MVELKLCGCSLNSANFFVFFLQGTGLRFVEAEICSEMELLFSNEILLGNK